MIRRYTKPTYANICPLSSYKYPHLAGYYIRIERVEALRRIFRRDQPTYRNRSEADSGWAQFKLQVN